MPTGRKAVRVLDQDNARLLGNSIQVDPGAVDAPGLNVIAKNFPLLQTSADEEANPSIITLALDRFLTNAGAGDQEQILVQGVLRYSTGSGQSGQPASTQQTLGGNQPVHSAEIVFDLLRGTMVSFPASAFTLGVRYTAVKRSAAFTLGTQIGPIFQVNAEVGYGEKTKMIDTTKTDPFVTLAPAGAATFVPPQYAQAVSFTWRQYKTAKPLLVQFLDYKSASLSDFIIDPSVVGTPFIPPPVLPLPESAAGVLVTNQDGANTMNDFICTWYLVI